MRSLLLAFLFTASAALADPAPANFAKDRLVAWCIVPFDAKKRGPQERAAMLKKLGITRCAYDWRAEHVPTFEAEIQAYKEHGIEFTAFWGEHPEAFERFKANGMSPQIWKTCPSPKAETQEAKVEAAAEALLPLAKRCQHMGSAFGLYNHGGWGGEPENLVAVCRRLREMGAGEVGIVYNFHHAHHRIGTFAADLAAMRGFLLCVNLNGMNDGAKPKILPIGEGKHETTMIEALVASGYEGPVGILDHLNEVDSKVALERNLAGLEKVLGATSPPAP